MNVKREEKKILTSASTFTTYIHTIVYTKHCLTETFDLMSMSSFTQLHTQSSLLHLAPSRLRSLSASIHEARVRSRSRSVSVRVSVGTPYDLRDEYEYARHLFLSIPTYG